MRPTSKNLRTLPEGVHCLERGVYLRVTKTSRYWIFKYQINGRRTELGLGGIDQSILLVQSKAAKYRAMLAEGKDPKRTREEKKEVLFKNFTEEALKHIFYVRQFTSENRKYIWLSATRQLVNRWGTRELKEITVQDIVKLLKPLWLNHYPTANTFLTVLKGLFDYAVKQGYITSNPAVWENNLVYYLPSAKQVRKLHPIQHHKALSPEELKKYLPTLRNGSIVQKVCYLTALCATRLSELAKLQWDEIDFNNKIIKVPTERRKDRNPEPFLVPLSNQAIEFLQSIPRVENSPYVFTDTGTAPLKVPRISRVFTRLTGANLHGCRSTFSDWCAKNNKNFLVSEKCLMHAVGNQVFRAYQRDDLLEQRRILLQEWADFLHS